MSLWAGRVEGSLDPAVWEFLRVDDAELLPYDCEASCEHARRLFEAGILSTEELAEVESKLSQIAQDRDAILREDEDVHSAIERLLGETGRKIHAGRSRNDQVAAAFRLVLDAAPGARRDDALLVVLSFAEDGIRHAAARLHAPPARPAGDARPPPARLGGDARP